MDGRITALTAALSLSLYWLWVLVMLVTMRRKLGKTPNAIPHEPVGKMMRLVWYPCIAGLIAALWLAAGTHAHPRHGALVLGKLWDPQFGGAAWWAVMVPAALLGGVCIVFTFVCWRKMGRSWRIGIDPKEKLALVSTGPYRYVRHPIYALRMVINVCACVMAPTPLVLAMAAVDIVLLQVEARREERYMESKHGVEYAKYKNSVGRFVPRAVVG